MAPESIRPPSVGVEAEVQPTATSVAGELGLGREQGVGCSQKRPWAAAASLGLGGVRCQWMALGDRQVAKGEDEAVAEAVADSPKDHWRRGRGALEVAEHDQLQRPAPLAADVILESSWGVSVSSTRQDVMRR